LNDPFGGWVYWDRLDSNYLETVELTRGASTSVFGDRAMGGTISIFSPTEKQQHIWADVMRGNQGTGDLSAAYSNLWGHWGFSVHSRAFTTDGYYIVPQNIRGKVDNQANVRFATGDVHLDYLGEKDRLSLHFDVLAEERHNGTQLTHNSTSLGTIGVNYTHSWTSDQVSVIGYHTQEQFHSTYSSVSANRNTETLTAKQTVPVMDTGGAAYWKHHAERWNTIVAQTQTMCMPLAPTIRIARTSLRPAAALWWNMASSDKAISRSARPASSLESGMSSPVSVGKRF